MNAGGPARKSQTAGQGFVASAPARALRKVSIIIPTLNEAELILPLLRHLRERASGAEIVVVDGGSSDGTAELADDLCDSLVRTKANRALQMNTGARFATGEVFWFLHADVSIPFQSLHEINRALDDPRVVGGFFRIALPRPGFVYRLTDSLAHYLGLLLRMRCGDHGIFCRRKTFEELGGFQVLPLMEDVEFYRAALRLGKMQVIPDRIEVSPRRYEAIGPLRLSLSYGLLGFLYLLDIPAEKLAALYNRLCGGPKMQQ
jgi:rSAM/selenodomain-associated transferase 2